MSFQPKQPIKDEDFYNAFVLTLKSLKVNVTSKYQAVCVYKQLRRDKYIANNDKFMEKLAWIYNHNKRTSGKMSARAAAQYYIKTFKRHAKDYDYTLQISLQTQENILDQDDHRQ